MLVSTWFTRKTTEFFQQRLVRLRLTTTDLDVFQRILLNIVQRLTKSSPPGRVVTHRPPVNRQFTPARHELIRQFLVRVPVDRRPFNVRPRSRDQCRQRGAHGPRRFQRHPATAAASAPSTSGATATAAVSEPRRSRHVSSRRGRRQHWRQDVVVFAD